MKQKLSSGNISSGVVEDLEVTQEWQRFDECVESWLSKRNQLPGSFCEDEDEKAWNMLKDISLPVIFSAPILLLPLRVHLAQGSEFGCSLTSEDCNTLVTLINSYWKQTNICWYLADVVSKVWANNEDGTREHLIKARDFIWSLKRGSSGAMENKHERRQVFLDQLLPEHVLNIRTYDVYVFDFIGKESQGCCISRDSHTVIIGNRSTKGYPEPTTRPLDCLAKTAAHELGHALGLGHPFGLRFSDGVSRTLVYGRDNLMQGGADVRGGGGSKLEEWQIVVSRNHARLFLHSLL